LTVLDDWLRAVVDTPGLTALDFDAARPMLLEDALRVLPVLTAAEGPVVDVGSGNGSPGIPVAVFRPDLEVVLLETERRRCDFLAGWAPANARVVCGRAEEQQTDWAGAALAKALAPPPVAAEWCLPLVRSGGIAVLWVGESADLGHLGEVAKKLAGELESTRDGLVVLRKVGPTPGRFPRRTGVARKRPL
jgi:16S rRNA (guanine527-N7)-methyltransferase